MKFFIFLPSVYSSVAKNAVQTVFIPEEKNCREPFDSPVIEELVYQKICPDSKCMDITTGLIQNPAIFDDVLPTVMCREICHDVLLDYNEQIVKNNPLFTPELLIKERACLIKNGGNKAGGEGKKCDPPVDDGNCAAGCTKEGDKCVAGAAGGADDGSSCQIHNFCKRPCKGYRDLCLMIVDRTICHLKSKERNPLITTECYVQQHTEHRSPNALSANKVREMVNDAGIKAYNAAALREQAVCEKYEVPKEECTFDRAFEVQAQIDLKKWFDQRAARECEFLNKQSPSWMKPTLDCSMCSDPDKPCDDNIIAARQMRIQYHHVRFAELMLTFKGERDTPPVGAIDWVVNYFSAQPNGECFSNFFGLQRSKRTKDKRIVQAFVAEPPADICLEALGDEMALMLSVDKGRWYADFAKKIFNLFFSSPFTGEELQPTLDVTDKELFIILERGRSDLYQDLYKERIGMVVNDQQQSSRDSHEKFNQVSYDFGGKEWTAEVAIKMLKGMIKSHDRALPFIVQSEEIRHLLWITLVFLQRADKHQGVAPNYGNVANVLNKLKTLFVNFNDRLANGENLVDVNECGVAFYGILNAGSDIKYAARIAQAVPRAKKGIEDFFKGAAKSDFKVDDFWGEKSPLKKCIELAKKAAAGGGAGGGEGEGEKKAKEAGMMLLQDSDGDQGDNMDSSAQQDGDQGDNTESKSDEATNGENPEKEVPKTNDSDGTEKASPEDQKTEPHLPADKTEGHQDKEEHSSPDHEKEESHHKKSTDEHHKKINLEDTPIAEGEGDKKDTKSKISEKDHAKGKYSRQYQNFLKELENILKLLDDLKKYGGGAGGGEAAAEPAPEAAPEAAEAAPDAAAAGGSSKGMTPTGNPSEAMHDTLKDIVQLQLGPFIVELLESLVQNYSESYQRVKLLRSTFGNIWKKSDEHTFTDLLDIKFRWYGFLSQSEIWPDIIENELNDGGLIYRKKEMDMIQSLCKIFRIDPYTSYTPPDTHRKDVTMEELINENYDKQQCSLKNILSRQWALKGREQFQINTSGNHHIDKVMPGTLLDKFKFVDENHVVEEKKEEEVEEKKEEKEEVEEKKEEKENTSVSLLQEEPTKNPWILNNKMDNNNASASTGSLFSFLKLIW